MGRIGFFILGLILGAVILTPAGLYFYVKSGGLSMTTSARPLPFERAFAHAALRASIGNASKIQCPLPATEANPVGRRTSLSSELRWMPRIARPPQEQRRARRVPASTAAFRAKRNGYR